MPSFKHAQAVVIPPLLGLALWCPAAVAQSVSSPVVVFASEIGPREVVGHRASGTRVDRTVVSPFDGSRRIIVRPGGFTGDKAVDTVLSLPDRPADGGIPVQPVAQAPQIEPYIGSGVTQPVVFVDIGPYDALSVSVPPPE